MLMEKPHYYGQIATILLTAEQNLSVSIEDNLEAGGSPFVVRLSFKTGGDVDVAGVMNVCTADAVSLASHLLKAANILDQAGPEVRAGLNGVRRLPIISLCGTRFFIDERLRQLRNVGNPDHYFDLDESYWR